MIALNMGLMGIPHLQPSKKDKGTHFYHSEAERVSEY